MMLLAILILTIAMGSFTIALEYMGKGNEAIGWRVVKELARNIHEEWGPLVVAGAILAFVTVFALYCRCMRVF